MAAALCLAMLHVWWRRRSKVDDAEILKAVLGVCGGVIVTDGKGNVVRMNKAAAAVTGCLAGKSAGLPVELLLALSVPGTGEKAESPVRKAIASGSGVNWRVLSLAAVGSGRGKLVKIRVEPVWGRGGALINTVVMIDDVTGQRSRRARMAAALRGIRAATAAAGMDLGQAGSDGSNPRPLLGRMDNWGRDADGNPLQLEAWVHPDDREHFRNRWQALLAGKDRHIDFQYRSLCGGAAETYRFMASRPESGAAGIAFAVQRISAAGGRRIADADSLLRKVIESLPCYMVVKDADDDDRYLIANAAWRNALGVADDQIAGRTDFELFDVETAKRFRREDRRVLETGGILTCVEELPTPLGTRRIQSSKTSFQGSDGRSYLLAAAIDVTGLLAAQQAAEESKLLLSAVFEHVPVGLFLKDADDNFRYRMWNGKLSEYLCAPAEKMVGKTDFETSLFPELTEYFRRQDIAVMAGGRQVFGDELRECNGELRHYHMTKLPIRMPSGRRYLLGAFIDFTERLRLENELHATISRQNRLLNNEQIYNACLREISSDSDYNRVVCRILEVIGSHFQAGRCFVTCYSPPADFTDRSFEWTADGVEPQMEFWEGVPPSEFPSMLEDLQSCKSCRVDRELKHPEVLNRMKELIGKRLDAVALAVAAVEYRGREWGVIGVARVGGGEPFTADDEEMLKNCASLFLLAKEHALQEMRLDAAMRIRKMVFSHIAIPIVLFDRNGKVANANAAACRLARRSEQELQRQLCWNCFCGHDIPPENCPVRRCLVTGNAASAIMEVSGRVDLVTAEPILDHGGRLEYVVETTVDISPAKLNAIREDESQ